MGKTEAQPDYKTTEVLTASIYNKKIEFSSKLDDVFAETEWDKPHTTLHSMPHAEPHAIRRKEILRKYPEIKKLMTKNPLTGLITILVTLMQLTIAYYIQSYSWTVFLIVTYVVGGTLNHTLQVLVHELTHYLGFESMLVNRIFAIITNFATLVPSAITFGKYHWEHHQHQGNHDRDADLPTKYEVEFFNTPLRKLCFVFLHPVFYGVRPMLVMPKRLTSWEVFNYAVLIVVDYLIWTQLGKGAFLYLFLSTFFSMGLHPAAAHVIAEHYEFVKGQETYNYFGFWNFFNLNLGYHTEHHDFPFIPWSNLPQVRKIAPEFYEYLPYHTSYVMVIVNYIMDKNMGPFARVDSTPIQKQ